MKRLIASTSVLGFAVISLLAQGGFTSAAQAAEPAVAPAKEAPAKPAKPKAVEKTAEPTTPGKKPAAPAATGELSAADKKLVAHAAKSSATLTEPQKAKLLDLVNTGDDKAVTDLPGVGEKKAADIKAARPLKTVDDLILVKGIGEVTFDSIVKFAAGDFKAEEKPAKKEAAPKKEPAPAKEAAPKNAPTKKTT